jgi:A/G-specific adenine glycosylase
MELGFTREKIARFQERILKWYLVDGRRFPWRDESASDYMIILAELLLQRTKAETVSKYYYDFLKKYPSWEDIKNADKEELSSLLRPFGLINRRTITLKLLAAEMVKRKGDISRERNELELLPGIGQYIANAILLFCHGEPHPLLDTNMARVLERVFGKRKLADIRYDPYLQSLSYEVIKCDKPKEINWAILDLAALICTIKIPKCFICPVYNLCNYADSL